MAKWNNEQKLKALALAEASSAAKAAEKMGIPRGTILRWMNESKNESNQNESKRINESAENKSNPESEQDNLTDKQRRFVQEYLIDLNATQAAIRAGYSEKTAMEQGYQLLRKTSVNEAISVAQQDLAQRLKFDQEKLAKEYLKIAFTDIKDFLSFRTEKTIVGTDDKGEPIFGYQQVIEMKPSEEVDGSRIAEVSISPKGVFSFKLHDKMKALEMLGKHLGMFHEKIDVKHSGEVKTVHEQNYNITQTIISEHPELLDDIFRPRVESRSS